MTLRIVTASGLVLPMSLTTKQAAALAGVHREHFANHPPIDPIDFGEGTRRRWATAKLADVLGIPYEIKATDPSP